MIVNRCPFPVKLRQMLFLPPAQPNAFRKAVLCRQILRRTDRRLRRRRAQRAEQNLRSGKGHPAQKNNVQDALADAALLHLSAQNRAKISLEPQPDDIKQILSRRQGRQNSRADQKAAEHGEMRAGRHRSQLPQSQPRQGDYIQLIRQKIQDDCPIRYDTVEQIFKENFGGLNIGLMHEAIASRRYYLDGRWSEENWSQGEDTFYSSDTSNAYCKTTTRTLMDVDELTLYRQLGSSDRFNNHNPNATARFCRMTLMESPRIMNLIAEFDAADLINMAACDLDHEEHPDQVLAGSLDQAKQYFNEGQSYAMMAGYYEALGDTNTANWMYSRASSSQVLAQQYAQNAMISDNSFTAVEGESYTH